MPLKRPTIFLDPHDTPERTPTIPGLPAEDEQEEPTGPGLGSAIVTMSPEPGIGDMPLPIPPIEPVPVMVQSEPFVEEDADPWADAPDPRSSGVPDWAPISAMVLWALVSFVALLDRF